MEYGFLDVHIDDSMTNLCDMLPASKHIVALDPPQLINGHAWSFLERSIADDATRVGWQLGELFSEGAYGKLYRAHRMVVERRSDGKFDVTTAPHLVVIKRSGESEVASMTEKKVIAHTSEALLHVLAWKVLQTTDSPWGVPRPFEVFGTRSGPGSGSGSGESWAHLSFCMSYVEGETLNTFMRHLTATASRYESARVFLEIFAQIAYILHPLQQILRMNHRDLKMDNIIVERIASPITLRMGTHTLTTRYKVTLIDFGFACVGCPPPPESLDDGMDATMGEVVEFDDSAMTPVTPSRHHRTDDGATRSHTDTTSSATSLQTAFQAGSFFALHEVCVKRGRDLAQLLYCVHCYFPLDTFLPSEFSSVKSWLQFSWRHGRVNGLLGFTPKGRPQQPVVGDPRTKPVFDVGIYEFLRRPDVDPVACEPATVFASICGMLATKNR